MDQERNLGVTEARFALTILTCLLVAIGYIALLRVGTKDPAIDAGPEDVSPPSIADSTPLPDKPELQPRVLPVVKPGDERNEPASLANRPLINQQLPEPELR